MKMIIELDSWNGWLFEIIVEVVVRSGWVFEAVDWFEGQLIRVVIDLFDWIIEVDWCGLGVEGCLK